MPGSPEELDEWMTAARDDGDQDAFALLVEDCQHLIRGMLLRETANPELADEIAQETFVRAWTRREQYRPGTSPRAWLITIARSQLMERHRQQDRNRRHMKELVRRELLRHQQSTGEETTNIRTLRLEALRRCMAKLGEEHRHLLDLVHGQGMTSEAAAEIIGIKPPACRQRISRLQRRLRTCAESELEAGDLP